MSERPAFDGARQRDVLTALQKKANIDATVAARSVNLSYPQYNRYLWGRLPLRSDQFGAFADTYDVKVWTLLRLLFTDVPVETLLNAGDWTLAGDLRGEIPESDIPEFEDEHGGKSQLDAAAAARGVKRNANRARSKSGIQPKPSGPNRNRTA